MTTLSPGTILLVEDDADDVLLIRRAFQKAGLDPEVAPKTWASVFRELTTDGSVHLILCVASWSYFAAPAWRSKAP